MVAACGHSSAIHIVLLETLIVDKFCVSLGVPIGAIGSTTCTYSCPINSAAESFNCNHGTGKWIPENSTLTCKGIDEDLFETI